MKQSARNGIFTMRSISFAAVIPRSYGSLESARRSRRERISLERVVNHLQHFNGKGWMRKMLVPIVAFALIISAAVAQTPSHSAASKEDRSEEHTSELQ